MAKSTSSTPTLIFTREMDVASSDASDHPEPSPLELSLPVRLRTLDRHGIKPSAADLRRPLSFNDSDLRLRNRRSRVRLLDDDSDAPPRLRARVSRSLPSLPTCEADLERVPSSRRSKASIKRMLSSRDSPKSLSPALKSPMITTRASHYSPRETSRATLLATHDDRTRVRARSLSLSPPPRREELGGELRARLDRTIRQLVSGLRLFRSELTDPAASVVMQQLLLHTDLVLDACATNTLSSDTVLQVTHSIAVLQQTMLGERDAHLMKQFLLLLARPARLLECLEHDTADPEASEPAPDRALQLAALRNDVPAYILGRLTAHFGSPAPPERSATGSPVAGAGAFVSLGEVSHEDFVIEKRLSAGAYGTVFLAHHRRTNELVAIKKLRKRDMQRKNVIHQAMAERTILQFVHNPFIVSMFCSYTTRDALYLVMEFLSGGDLAALLKNLGRFSEREMRRYVAETVLAIEYIHNYGIVHRDLKPDNLMLTEHGHVKLTDFGLSKIGLMQQTVLLDSSAVDATASFKDSQVLGTPDYIAPEVVLAQGYGPAVDWWSLGIIAYEFLVGVPPFHAETVEKIFHNALNNDIQWPPCSPDFSVSVNAMDFVSLLLNKSPEQRLGTVPALSHSPFEHTMHGASYVKDHPFFFSRIEDEGPLDFDALLEAKACFVPSLDTPTDTSYFDDRRDRYDHSSEDDEDKGPIDDTLFKDYPCVRPVSGSLSASPSVPTTPRRLSGAFDFPELRLSSLAAIADPPQPAAAAALPPSAAPLVSGRQPVASISPPHSVRSGTGTGAGSAAHGTLLRRGSSERGAESSTTASTRSHASAPDPDASATCTLGCRSCRTIILPGQQHGFGFSLRTEVLHGVRRHVVVAVHGPHPGLRAGDIVMQVNGLVLAELPAPRVSRLVRQACQSEMVLHVCSRSDVPRSNSLRRSPKQPRRASSPDARAGPAPAAAAGPRRGRWWLPKFLRPTRSPHGSLHRTSSDSLRPEAGAARGEGERRRGGSPAVRHSLARRTSRSAMREEPMSPATRSSRATPDHGAGPALAPSPHTFERSRSHLSFPPVSLTSPRPESVSCQPSQSPSCQVSPTLTRRHTSQAQAGLHSPLRDSAGLARDEAVSQFEAVVSVADNMFASVAAAPLRSPLPSTAMPSPPPSPYTPSLSSSVSSPTRTISAPLPPVRAASHLTHAHPHPHAHAHVSAHGHHHSHHPVTSSLPSLSATALMTASATSPSSHAQPRSPLHGRIGDLSAAVSALDMDDVPESSL